MGKLFDLFFGKPSGSGSAKVHRAQEKVQRQLRGLDRDVEILMIEAVRLVQSNGDLTNDPPAPR